MNNLDNNQKQNIKDLTPEQARIKLLRKLLSDKSVEARQFREGKIIEAEKQGNETEALRWAAKTINAILIMWEKERTGAVEFNTFNQWRELGYSVVKGEECFRVWGAPRNANSKEEQPQSSEPQELSFSAPNAEEPQENQYEFYPMCCLFSNLQVQKSDYQIKPRFKKDEEQHTGQRENISINQEDTCLVID